MAVERKWALDLSWELPKTSKTDAPTPLWPPLQRLPDPAGPFLPVNVGGLALELALVAAHGVF